jgi:hypothetical protein
MLGCEATVKQLHKELYKLSTRPKAESRVRKVLDRVCNTFEKGFIIVTDSNGKKTATTFEGNISGSIDMSPQISTDLVEICTHLTEDYYEEFLHAFRNYDVDLQNKICTEISHCKLTVKHSFGLMTLSSLRRALQGRIVIRVESFQHYK